MDNLIQTFQKTKIMLLLYIKIINLIFIQNKFSLLFFLLSYLKGNDFTFTKKLEYTL